MTHMNVSHPYFGAFFMLLFAFAMFFVIVELARFVGSKFARTDTEKLKLTIYECGPEVTKQPNAISSHFYMFAILSILFGVEFVFMFPWAIDFKILGMFGFVEMILFILLLAIGFIYAWKKGALQWQIIQ
ncbi:MAG: NADH-quinone oxidoreductase subunit A [Proteobacteria bacterium]|nr:MAG: NADH-quinone oxidoreductase subunit A [Pseudomonadota bacterium]